jgi:hypothetical protein
MQNKTFISSMVGVAAAVAVAGSAMAAVVDPFTDASSVSSGASSGSYISSGNTAISGGLWNNRVTKVFTSSNLRATSNVSVTGGSLVFSVTQVGSSQSANQKGLVEYSNVPAGVGPDFSNFTSLTFDYNSTFNFGVRVHIDGMTSNFLEQTGVTAGNGTLTFTRAQFNFDGTETDVPSMWVEFFRQGSNASGSLTVTNLSANGVPAPGAIALLGAAGLIGARRRRA